MLLGRKLETLEARADSIRAALSEARIECQDTDIATLVVDFTDMESVKLAAAEAMNRFPRIHGLILSAVLIGENAPKILPNGHELRFATNVIGPFLFTQLLLDRMQQADGLVLQVTAPWYKEIDWDDLESINHKAMTAYEIAKTMQRAIAAELARRYAGKISSVAFNPYFIIDKSQPEQLKRWPIFWRVLAVFLAKPPAAAGEPIADLMLSYRDRAAINGAYFKLSKRIEKPDKAMYDEVLGKKLWNELIRLTGLTLE